MKPDIPFRPRTVIAVATSLSLTFLAGCRTPDPTEGDVRASPLDSTRLLADARPATAEAWDLWRRDHPSATVEWSIDAGTLEATPLEATFFATAYATPVIAARRTPDRVFRHPIYATPDRSISDNDLPVRRDLRSSELPTVAWVANGLDAYLVEVNGAARLDLPDGSSLHLGWGRTNERPYTSLGRLLIERGVAEEEDMNLDTIRVLHDSDPELVESLMIENDRVVFFDVIEADAWPRASSGERLVPRRSVAVDPDVIPLGSVLRVRGPSIGTWFAVAVDTGGAIKGRRIDLYFGSGSDAVEHAGLIREDVEIDLIRPRRRSFSR